MIPEETAERAIKALRNGTFGGTVSHSAEGSALGKNREEAREIQNIAWEAYKNTQRDLAEGNLGRIVDEMVVEARAKRRS